MTYGLKYLICTLCKSKWRQFHEVAPDPFVCSRCERAMLEEDAA